MSVTYRPATSWTHVVWNGAQFVRANAGMGHVEFGWDLAWHRVHVPETDILRYLWAAAAPDGAVACVGVGADDHAYLVTYTRVTNLGPCFGQNCVGLYWSAGWIPVIQRSNTHYSVGELVLPFPPHILGTSQGFRDVQPDGTIIFGDDAHVVLINGIVFHKPMTRGNVTVGQMDGTDYIHGAHRDRTDPEPLHFDAISRATAEPGFDPGPCFEPHVAWDGLAHYAVVARTGIGAAVNTHPPYPPIVVDPPEPEPEPEAPTCTITSYPMSVVLGDPALAHASYGGGPIEVVAWRYKLVSETIWITASLSSTPATEFDYGPHFTDAGAYHISLGVEGPGGADETQSERIIDVQPQEPDPEPEPKPMRQQVAFAPNIGSVDFTQLFTEPNLWQFGWDRISALHFYWHNLVEGTKGDPAALHQVNDNIIDRFYEAGAFWKLRDAGILIEVEVGGPGEQVIEAAEQIDRGDGQLTVVVWDKVLLEITPEQFKTYYDTVKAYNPNIIIGVYAAMLDSAQVRGAWRPDATRAYRLSEHLFEWDKLGCRPAFVRMDTNGNLSQAEFNAIRAACSDRTDPPVTLQMTVIGPDGQSDADYVRNCKRFFDDSMRFGTWDQVMVQSWATTEEHSGGLFTVPANLPDSDDAKHTNLLNYVLERFL